MLIVRSIRKYIKDTNLVVVSEISNSIYSTTSGKIDKVNPDGVDLIPTVIDVQFVSATTGKYHTSLNVFVTVQVLFSKIFNYFIKM